jgi:DNA invertase Pin-like site-specific DNA recombinase
MYRLSVPIPEGFDKMQEDHVYNETQYQQILDAYLEQSPDNDEELFCKEITKMRLMGMTYREIKGLTGINLDTINKAINKFKYDLHCSITIDRHCQSSPEFRTA